MLMEFVMKTDVLFMRKTSMKDKYETSKVGGKHHVALLQKFEVEEY